MGTETRDWPDAVDYLLTAEPQPLQGAIGGPVILYGFSVRETSGATTAQVLLLNGQNANGLEVLGINLDPNESTRDWMGPNGVLFNNGFFSTIVSGAVAGSLWIGRRNRE